MVEGRARAREDAPANPTLHLTLEASTFWRLGCGRVDPSQVLSGTDEITGDSDLATAVVGHMNFMF
jgi:hypothetical protein